MFNSKALAHLFVQTRQQSTYCIWQCRYLSLQQLQLPWLSQKRAQLLAEDFVTGQTLKSVFALCRREPFAIPKQLLHGSIQMNASVEQLKEAADALDLKRFPRALGAPVASGRCAEQRPQQGTLAVGGAARPSRLRLRVAEAPTQLRSSASQSACPEDVGASQSLRSEWLDDPLSAAFHLYDKERYVLLPRPGADSGAEQFEGEKPVGMSWALLGVGPAFVMGLKAGASGVDELQGLLQAVKLRELMHGGLETAENKVAALAESLEYAKKNIGEFVAQLKRAGWNVETVLMESSQTHELVIRAE
jgi:hypothetical protein